MFSVKQDFYAFADVCMNLQGTRNVTILLAMPCYCYIIKAWSPRDGGWMRLFGYFKTEQDAWDVIYFLTPFILDFEGFNVVRTIKF